MDEVPLMKLSMHLDPEALAMLRSFVERLQAMESELKEIRRLLAEAPDQFFKITELPSGLSEAVIARGIEKALLGPKSSSEDLPLKD